jgi:hypothetical protein
MKEMRLTGTKTGEKTGNFKSLGKDGLIIADRAYGSIAGMEYREGKGSDYLPGYRSGDFNLYKETRERGEVTDFFRELGAGCRGEGTLYYQTKGEYRPIRVCGDRENGRGGKERGERLEAVNRKKSRGKRSWRTSGIS